MIGHLSFLLLLSLFTLIILTNCLTFNEIPDKKKCTSSLRNPSVPCSTEFRQDMCAYISGDPCVSDEYCAMLSINQCTACHESSVQFYSSQACNNDKVYCDLNNRPNITDANLTTQGTVCAYYKHNCVLDICGIEATNGIAACATQYILYYKPGKCEPIPQIICNPDNRPKIQNSNLISYDPVCAYYKEDCPLNVCGMEAINSDFACSLNQTLYYTPGKCDSDMEIFSCDYSYCSTQEDFNEYDPVCGIQDNCVGSGCNRTFNNKCLSCASGTFSFYKKGICEKDRRVCNPNNRPTSCVNIVTRPVCAFFPNDLDELVFSTANNSCNACLDPNVKYYINGACNLSNDSAIYCFAGNRPQNCPETNATNETVCAFFDMALTSERFAEMSSACAACQNPNVSYYEPGPCEISCRSDEMRNAQPTDFNYSYTDPVCGMYTVNQQTYSLSLQNKYVACDNLVAPIDSYKPGLCPGDEGVQCTNNALGLTAGAIVPVCGVFEEGCQDDTCRLTFAEPAVACEYSSAILYQPGLCPDDEGVSCDPYRPIAGEQLCLFNDMVYSQVCGYFWKGCQDSSCRMTFSTQCKACSVSSVIFFTAGPCPDS